MTTPPCSGGVLGKSVSSTLSASRSLKGTCDLDSSSRIGGQRRGARVRADSRRKTRVTSEGAGGPVHEGITLETAGLKSLALLSGEAKRGKPAVSGCRENILLRGGKELRQGGLTGFELDELGGSSSLRHSAGCACDLRV